MADRPTFTLKTSGGHAVILNEYITGAENWQIREIYARGIKTGIEDSTTGFEAEKKAIEIVVVSLDGDSANIAERVMNLPLAEYREITDALVPIVEAKKKSQAS